MARFANRHDAGTRLAAALAYLRTARPLVFALPRGGVPVAAPVARALGAPLDVLLVRKIGAPGEPEFGIGAVADGAAPLLDAARVRQTGADAAWLARRVAEESAVNARRRRLYTPGHGGLDPAGRCCILVDDGIATGGTARAAIAALRARAPARLVLAIPVAPADALAALRPLVDELVCLHAPQPFGAVGRFYADFTQTADAEVIALLRQVG